MCYTKYISVLGMLQQNTKNLVAGNNKNVFSVWRPEVQNQSVSKVTLPLKAQGISLPCFLQLPEAPSAFWLMAAQFQSLSPSSHDLPICVGPLLSFLRTLTGFRTLPNKILSHFDSYLNYICKDPISKQDRILRFWVNMGFEEMLFNPLH